MNDDAPTLICIDLGTTNTRIWRTTLDGRVLIRRTIPMGVRDCAREGSTTRLRELLHDLIRDASVPVSDIRTPPIGVIAAGMITSALGLREVPHLPAPVGLKGLANAVCHEPFPDVTDLPMMLVPGVRCGTATDDEPLSAAGIDIMRGEETLCVGLHELALTTGGATLLNLGSHWKAVGIDSTGSIVASSTSLSGEMIHAVQERTILHDALASERPEQLDTQWLQAGMNEARANGLGRALFAVRLLQLAGKSTPSQRQAYFVGAFIAADLPRLINAIDQNARVLIAGNTALARAWQTALAERDVNAEVLNELVVEEAMLAGLGAIHALARRR